jgi:hypothetical protein
MRRAASPRLAAAIPRLAGSPAPGILIELASIGAD